MAMHGPSVDFIFEPIKPGMFSIPVGKIHEVGVTVDGLSSLFKSSATKAAEAAAEAAKAQADMKYVQVAGELEKAQEAFETAKADGNTGAMSDALDDWNSVWKKVQSDGDVNYSLSDDEQAALGKHGLDPTEEGGAADQLSDAQTEEWIKSLGDSKVASKDPDELFKTDDDESSDSAASSSDEDSSVTEQGASSGSNSDSASELGAIDGDDGLDDLDAISSSSAGQTVADSLDAGATTVSATGDTVVEGAAAGAQGAADVFSSL
jgi:hypothetical protein